MLVDSHAHIDTSRFHADREEVISAALEGGITSIVDPGCDLDSSRFALTLAKAHPGTIFAGVGTHPHDATTYSHEVGIHYREMAQEPEVVAIGEFGLDYFRMLSPRDVQRAVFCAHLQLARDCDLPCIIHVRDSHDDVIELLRTHGQGLRGVFHCFSGNVAQAEEGPQGHREARRLVPQAVRAKRNEPLFVKYVAEKLAEIKGMSFEEIAQVTTTNAVRLFNLDAHPSFQHRSRAERGESL